MDDGVLLHGGRGCCGWVLYVLNVPVSHLGFWSPVCSDSSDQFFSISIVNMMFVCILLRCCWNFQNSSILCGQITSMSSAYLYQQDIFLLWPCSVCDVQNLPWNNWLQLVPMESLSLWCPSGHKVFDWRESMWMLKTVWMNVILNFKLVVPW
jgi:hypothetical protein